jgi:hypothetical protein
MKNAREIVDPKLQMLVLERRNASCNIARFYVLAIEPTLFGDMALVRRAPWRLSLRSSLGASGHSCKSLVRFEETYLGLRLRA